MSIYSKLKELCLTVGISGREQRIRELISSEIEQFVDEVHTDALGNLIALKKGSGSKKIMLCAHMDEIGFLVNFIDDNGFVRVAPIGGIGFCDYAYSKVISENGRVGLMVPEAGVKPEELSADKMYIDIGARNKKEAERHVKIGDFFVAEPQLYRLCGKRIAGHPIDNRAGCAVLVEAAERLRSTVTDADIYFVFSVQEEVGCRGSMPASYTVAPDEAICVDVTDIGDVPSAKPMACALGKGAAVKIKDSSVICHEDMVNGLLETAKACGIPTQREVLLRGGTDTSAMQTVGRGAKAGAVSIPTRYIHSGTECCDLGDIEACVDLLCAYVSKRG